LTTLPLATRVMKLPQHELSMSLNGVSLNCTGGGAVAGVTRPTCSPVALRKPATIAVQSDSRQSRSMRRPDTSSGPAGPAGQTASAATSHASHRCLRSTDRITVAALHMSAVGSLR